MVQEEGSRSKCIWVKKKGKKFSNNIIVKIGYRLPSQEEEVSETLFKGTKSTQSYETILMTGFNFSDICWKNNTANHNSETYSTLCGGHD